MRRLLERVADWLAPHSRAFLIGAGFLIAVPIGGFLAAEKLLGTAGRAGFALVAAGLALGMWSAGLAMLGQRFHRKQYVDHNEEQWGFLRHWLGAVSLLVWFIAPLLFFAILFG